MRVVHQRSRDGDPLLLPAGKLHGPMVEAISEAHHFGKVDAAVPRLVIEPYALIEEGDFDILDDGILGQQIIRLKDESYIFTAYFGKLIIVHMGDIIRTKMIFAARGTIETTQHIEQCRFPGPGRSHQGDEVSLGKLESDVSQGTYSRRFQVIVFDQVDDLGNRYIEFRRHGMFRTRKSLSPNREDTYGNKVTIKTIILAEHLRFPRPQRATQ